MLEDEYERFRIDARKRVLLLGGLQGGLFLLLAGRLFQLQVLKGGDYKDLAEDNRISWNPIPAPRGRILDRFGQVMVDNVPDYRLLIVPERAGPLMPLVARLRKLVDLTDDEVEGLLKQVKRQRSFLPVQVKDNLKWEEVSRLEARQHAFPGMMIQAQSRRNYPHGNSAAHLLGYLGEVVGRDRERFSRVAFRSGDLVGKTGMERAFEKKLRGDEGISEIEVNAVGRQVRQLRASQPKTGEDLVLTIDMALQQDAEKALGNRAGAVVVMDPRSGEILALVSSPSYNPNQFIQGFTSNAWNTLINDPKRPLSNKVLQGQYPPGSTFKMVVALSALGEGVITPTQKLHCPGYWSYKGHRFHCWHRGGHGWVDLNKAMSQSCDVYFYRIADKLGIDQIHAMAGRFGFGQTTGIELGGESRGLNPSRNWKRMRHRKIWFPGETLITAIGQGYLSATPLQLVNMTATIANGGTLYQPSLVRPRGGYEPRVLNHARLDPEHLQLVQKSMEYVYYGRSGTARNAKPETVRAAGKTGTSQVVRHRRKTEGGKPIPEEQERFKDHALFVSYAPSTDPELAIAVIVEHGGHGGSTAAPVAQAIIDAHFTRRQLRWERRAV
ncbi:penicillin-binding protein 2 [Magnetococcus sp. PR-3]|uniref:penicillin-binding protein 2 n=1 Tax=Magnetococcus sp. PR-3 TaxID=3120355 RepID=UPI002FCE1B17